MKNILDNPGLKASPEWEEATAEANIANPLLQNNSILKQILDFGRWAPSGDNMQPWRFKLIDENHFDILASDTRDHCVYDLQGNASQLSIGMLIENMVIGAASLDKTLDYELDPDSTDEHPVIHVKIASTQPENNHAHLADSIILRTVNRRPLSKEKITDEHKQKIEEAASPLKIKWFEGKEIKKTTRLFFDAAGIRLSIAEAFPTHASIMEWNKPYSRDKMPVGSLGMSAMGTKMMKACLKDWRIVNFLNTFMAGTYLPRLELDVLPGLSSGAHFILIDDKVNESVSDFIEAGRLVQRFWIRLTSLGIQLQPQMTPLIFANYHRQSINFTSNKKQLKATEKLANKYKELIDGEDCGKTVFVGRIGYGDIADYRSTRLDLKDLLVE
ncbi:MAG: nitroreductase family protein [Gammaproteobacteria bacterium]|nr:nitroreductase family protein [Gammaproteobacteria bacterium]